MHNRGESSELVRYPRDVRSVAGDGQMYRRRQKGDLLRVAGRPRRMVVRSDLHRQNEFRESAIRAQHRHEGDHGQEDQAVDISRRHQTQHR